VCQVYYYPDSEGPPYPRYVMTSRGREVISAVLAAQRITLEQLNKLVA